MIIWRRKGWLVPIIFFVMLLVTQIAINSSLGDGYYQSHEWPKGLGIGLAALLIALFGYHVNYKKREVAIDPDTGVKTQASSHTLFFIPVEYWAVIIPVFVIWMNHYTDQKDQEELAYITAPKINDLYLLDITRTRYEIDGEFKYGIFKVVNVQSDGVDVVEASYVFDSKKGVRKEVRKGGIDAPDYFHDTTYFMDTDSLVALKNSGDIFKIQR